MYELRSKISEYGYFICTMYFFLLILIINPSLTQYIRSLTKILISILEGILKKFPECRIYQSEDEKSLS